VRAPEGHAVIVAVVIKVGPVSSGPRRARMTRPAHKFKIWKSGDWLPGFALPFLTPPSALTNGRISGARWRGRRWDWWRRWRR
jgi:hypothetical protein